MPVNVRTSLETDSSIVSSGGKELNLVLTTGNQAGQLLAVREDSLGELGPSNIVGILALVEVLHEGRAIDVTVVNVEGPVDESTVLVRVDLDLGGNGLVNVSPGDLFAKETS